MGTNIKKLATKKITHTHTHTQISSNVTKKKTMELALLLKNGNQKKTTVMCARLFCPFRVLKLQ